MQLTGNTILITGGGSGIGRGLAEAFHALGNRVVIAGLRKAMLDETVAANPGMVSMVLDIESAAILTVSSGLAFVPMAMTPTYCATKAAIHSYTQSLRYQLRDTAIQVLELIPPYVQTELSGPRQASDPNAMPLPEFIDETMSMMRNSPDATEICVERVLPLRNAGSALNYPGFFQKFNDAMAASAH